MLEILFSSVYLCILQTTIVLKATFYTLIDLKSLLCVLSGYCQLWLVCAVSHHPDTIVTVEEVPRLHSGKSMHTSHDITHNTQHTTPHKHTNILP